MTKKETFKAAVQSAVSAFNASVDPALQARINKANKLRQILTDLDFPKTDEAVSALAEKLDEADISSNFRDIHLGTVPRNLSAFLIFKATSNPNGHKYGSHWCFCRGPESRSPYIVSPSSDYAGITRNNTCEPEFWATPEADELDDVIEDAWNIILDNPESPIAKYIELYFAPLSFMFDADEERPARPAPVQVADSDSEETEE